MTEVLRYFPDVSDSCYNDIRHPTLRQQKCRNNLRAFGESDVISPSYYMYVFLIRKCRFAMARVSDGLPSVLYIYFVHILCVITASRWLNCGSGLDCLNTTTTILLLQLLYVSSVAKIPTINHKKNNNRRKDDTGAVGYQMTWLMRLRMSPRNVILTSPVRRHSNKSSQALARIADRTAKNCKVQVT